MNPETEICIRTSQLKDAPFLMEIDEKVWTPETTPSQVHWRSREQFLQSCPPGSQLVAVAGDSDIVLGYIGYKHPTELESNRHVYDIHIAVSPDHHRRGVGAKLMDALKRIAAQDGVRKLSLRVLSSNGRAIAFYEKCGFKEQGRLVEEFWLNGHYVDDILMYCLLEPSGRA